MFSSSNQRSQSESKPLSSEELTKYFSAFDETTGGRVGTYAREGMTPYIKSLGGYGATRSNVAKGARATAIEQITADPTLTLSQRQRSNQVVNDNYAGRLDAIAKETEAQIGELTQKELALLSDIYFKGKGQKSSSTGNSSSVGFGIKD